MKDLIARHQVIASQLESPAIDWFCAIAVAVVFSAIGVLLAWRA